MITENKAIVGYNSVIHLNDTPESIRHVTADLLSDIGFIRVIKKIHHLHAVLVQVIPNLIDNFIQSVERKDHIDYCVKDYILKLSGYQNYIPTEYIKTHKNKYSIKNIHNITINDYSGIGTKVALIDTGISPHPYLPSITFEGNINSSEIWHNTMRNALTLDSSLKRIFKFEKMTLNTSNSSVIKYVDYVKKELLNVEDETWNNWFSSFVYNQLSITSPPIYSNIIGAMRKLSPDSWNFVNDSFDLTDSIGHGTEMAGVISGLPPYSNMETNFKRKSIYEKFEPDVLGISPYSELVILKCYDNSNKLESSFLKMLDALEYCTKIDVDVIYIGIGFCGGIDPKKIKPLSKKLTHLKNIGVPIICPAGNIGDDPGDVDLEFPGADEDAMAISSIDFDKNSKFHISKHSKYANVSTDEVEFCAFGGEANNSLLLSTSCNFGFSPVSGTSISAAIATGIVASTKSRWYRGKLSRNLTNTLSGSSINYSAFKQGIKTGKMPYDQLVNILRGDANKAFNSKTPDHMYGYGLIREPYNF